MKRRVWLTLGVLAALAAVFFGIRTLDTALPPETPRTVTLGQTPATEPPAPRTAENKTDEGAGAVETEPEPYVSPIDFPALREVNPDIFAWLRIPDTEIDYPLVQDPENDRFYMDHDSDRRPSGSGALFTEAGWNGPDLEDPVTVVYGHHMLSGVMFGRLERYYTDADFFASHPTFTVYWPEGEAEYGVFAATPYSSEHLLKTHDFSDVKEFERFFSAVFSIRDLSARFNRDYAPGSGDRVLILSTCLTRNNSQRFLVMATRLANES